MNNAIKINKLIFDVVLIVIFLSSTLLFFKIMGKFAFSGDFPWLLESGKYILNHKELPSYDIFSWTNANKPWLLYQWLFEVFTATAYKYLGLTKLIFSFIIVLTIIYFLIPLLLASTEKIPTLIPLLISSLVLFMITLNIAFRPAFLASLFLLLQYLLLENFRRKKIKFGLLLFSLITIYIIWSNIHLSLIFGLLSLILMTIGDYLEIKKVYKYEPISLIQGNPLPLKNYVSVLCAVCIASLINPYGVGVHKYLYELSRQSYLFSHILESKSPDFHLAQCKVFLVLFLLFIFLLSRANKLLPARDILHIIVFSFITFIASRVIVWAGVFYVLIIPRALYLFFKSSTSATNSYFLKSYKASNILFTYIVGIILVSMLSKSFILSNIYGECRTFINGLVAYQTLSLPSDKVFSDPLIGSCSLIINPKQKVFIDTRFDFYQDDFSKEVRDICHLTTDTNSIKSFFDKWQINTVIISMNLPLSSYLTESVDYKRLYEDSALEIYRKK